MAANGSNSADDADMSLSDGEKVVTMMDVLQEQEDFEEDANAVLGASDDKNCTYSKGYVKRQAIYACLTCCPEAKTDKDKRAGVCLACSLHCHESHELIELYTKRNFRCDCGNPKFNSHPCQFTPNKSDLNYENKYNQNFSGVYCICHRPYPDPEATEEDEMIQCIVCEDWLHTTHLEATVPLNDQYAEMVCKDCMEDNDFLHDYSDLVINVVDKEIIKEDDDLYVDITSITKKSTISNGDSKTNEILNVKNDDNAEKDNVGEVTEKDTPLNETTSDNSESNVTKENIETENEIKEDTTEKTTENVEAAVNNIDKAAEDIETEPGKNTDKPDGENERTEEKAEVSEEINESKVNDEINKTEDNQVEESKDVNGVPEKDTNDSVAEVSGGKESKMTDEEPDAATLEKMEEDRLLQDDNESKVANGTTPNTEQTKENDEAKDNKNDEKSETVTTSETTDQNNLTTDTEMNDDTTNNDQSNKESTENKRKLSTDEAEDSQEMKKQKLESQCMRPRGVKRVFKGATFWPSNFRQKLCTCNECISMYKDLAVLFLIDSDDTVTAYEALGKENTEGGPSSQYEKGLQALSSLDRVQQINALTEYNKMRDKLLDFLKSFKDRKEIVKEEDIKAFFAGMKPKREPDGVYFCR